MIIDSERNRAVYLQLVDVVRGGRALGFAGAGVTHPLGYPSWNGLIDRLAAEVRAVRGEQIQSNGQSITVQQVLRDLKTRPLVQAQILKDSLGAAYFPLMANLFGPKDGRSACIADLVSLPFKHLLTSNYDPGLERHHAALTYEPICLHHPAAAQFLIHHAEEGYIKRIVHVHGKYDEPDRIILTEEDYGIYARSPVFQEFWHLFSLAVRLVFFGFSCNDIDLLYRFRHIRMALGGNGLELAPRHFAVMDLVDASQEVTVAVSLRMQYGIEPVFYPNPKSDFAGYDDFMAELKRDVCGPTAERLGENVIVAPPEQVQPEVAEQPPAEAVQQGVERLKQITLENLGRRQTGDL